MGCSFDEWHDIIETLRPANRILTFHRQGLGQSDIGEGVCSTETAVRDLNELLAYFEIEEPIYLVGHSYGGLCAQHFAKVFPERVAGVILVDSTSVNLKELDELDTPVMNEESDEAWIEKCLDYAGKDKQELQEIIKPALSEQHLQFPKVVKERLLDFQITPTLYKAMASEIQQWKKDAEIIKRLGGFPNVPLIVIGRDSEFTINAEVDSGIPLEELRRFEEKWRELIRNQGRLSKKNEVIFADKAGHSVYLDRPDLIVDCIHRMISC
ncbi:alpha/beta hydrolase [Rossellomorea vietnamensis]|uniref:Alpha/beta hydrolase n=2 Tax=Rossellomorea vietnamensis TaxID=218284 RepID=A0A5D4NU43_9BACI|nr:alpha/beta hydrolase [Rossellomorea vietnamensis]